MIIHGLASLKTKIENLKHAILKTKRRNDVESCIVETLRVADEGYIFCYSEDEVIKKSNPFHVSLKYIDKENGEYIVVDGLASQELIPLPRTNTVHYNKIKSAFKIKINRAHYFQKEQYCSEPANMKHKFSWNFA